MIMKGLEEYKLHKARLGITSDWFFHVWTTVPLSDVTHYYKFDVRSTQEDVSAMNFVYRSVFFDACFSWKYFQEGFGSASPTDNMGSCKGIWMFELRNIGFQDFLCA